MVIELLPAWKVTGAACCESLHSFTQKQEQEQAKTSQANPNHILELGEIHIMCIGDK